MPRYPVTYLTGTTDYTINYLDGTTETIEADGVEYDSDARDYTFIKDKQAVALAPVANVRSVVRQDTGPKASVTYPHQDGDVTVLGPEVFASTDREVRNEVTLKLDDQGVRGAITADMNKAREQAAELERLHTGEEPVTDERITPTPGQWIWKWNRVTPEKRLDMAAQILDNMPIARNCFMNDHEAQIERLRAEVERLRGETERSPKE
ncbi:hypothetical protein ACFYVK_35430 [Streptomyces chartreusis]|uniref:hypothetical protein n=1 Tax=Streptomyces chartreusis TaxID=1969 RepID=UPI003695DFD3